MSFRRFHALFLVSCCTCIAVSAEPDYKALGNDWWSHVKVLADDGLAGRDTGSAGYRTAAAYVVDQFKKAGLEPGGNDGYYQPVKLNVLRLNESQSSAALVYQGRETPLTLGDQFIIGKTNGSAPSVDGPLVFAGYGLKIPEAKYDDFAGLDVKDKIVVILTGSVPKGISSALAAHFSSRDERTKTLREAGAVGAILVANPKTREMSWDRSKMFRFQPSMVLADSSVPSLEFSGTLNSDLAEPFFAHSGHTFSEIISAANAGKPVVRFNLNQSLRAKVAIDRSTAESANVAGVLPGSDPVLKNEYVVMSAHLDHIGVGKPVNGDTINNGAMDDASGVAAEIEVAHQLKRAGSRLKRSVLFLCVTGEEKGLLGSRYFAEHPTVPIHQIVADINLDMFLPLYPLHTLEVQGLNESTLGQDLARVAAAHSIDVQPDQHPGHNLFIRSDQYNFVLKGVPAIFFGFGFGQGTKEQKIQQQWFATRYHSPSDDTSQPVDLAAAGQFNEIVATLLERVANAPQRPAWLPSSFFKRFAAKT